MRKLASVQKIVNIEPITGADLIQLATILDWKVIVKKGEFNINDLVVYFEPDSLIPRYNWSNFLFKNDQDDFARIKVMKMRGVYSYGLVIPYQDIFGAEKKYETGDDVTEILGIKKWEFQPDCPSLKGKIIGQRPYFVPKTDELRLQACGQILDRYRLNTRFYISEKCDGSSSSFYLKDGEFGVCSRNNLYNEDDDNLFSTVARKLDVKDRLKQYNKNLTIQGELLSPSVQKNKYKFNEATVYFFNVYDIEQAKYVDYSDFVKIIADLGLTTVPIIDDNFFLQNNTTVENLINMAIGESRLAKIKREGLVFRSFKEKIDIDIGRLSFKTINPEFLIKYNE